MHKRDHIFKVIKSTKNITWYMPSCLFKMKRTWYMPKWKERTFLTLRAAWGVFTPHNHFRTIFAIVMKLCPSEQNLVTTILKSKCPPHVTLSMCKWYISEDSRILQTKVYSEKQGPCHILTMPCHGINLKLSPVSPLGKRS